MIKFRQKNFFWQAAGTLLTGGMIFQGLGQSKDAAAQAEAQKEQMDRQAALLRQQNKKLEELSKLSARNPDLASGLANTFEQRAFAIPALLSNVGKAAKVTFKDGAVGNILMAGTSALATYGLGRYIANDMHKEHLDVLPDGTLVKKDFSATPSPTSKPGFWSKHKGSLLFGAGFGVLTAIPTLIGYNQEKKQLKDQIRATEKNFGMSTAGVSNFFKGIAAHPVRSLSNFALQWGTFGLGSTQSIQKFGRHLQTLGQGRGTGIADKWTKRIGDWITEKKIDPKTGKVALDKTGKPVLKHGAMANLIALAPLIPVAKLTWNGVESALGAGGKKIDPEAYKYLNSKEEMVQ